MSKDEDKGRAQLAMAIKAAQDRLSTDLLAEIEMQRVLAKCTRIKFDALLAEGFTEAQAIALCK